MSHNAPVRKPLDLSMGRLKKEIFATIRSDGARMLLSRVSDGGTFERFVKYLGRNRNISEQSALLHALQSWVERRLKAFHPSIALSLASDCVHIGIIFATVDRIPEAIEWYRQGQCCIARLGRSAKKDPAAQEVISYVYTEKAKCYEILGETKRAEDLMKRAQSCHEKVKNNGASKKSGQ